MPNKSANASIDTSLLGRYYRFTYKGIGIYEAYHQYASPKQWKDFLASHEAKWLPNPDPHIKTYRPTYASFFTQAGYDAFSSMVLPIFLQVLNKKDITLQEFTDVPLKYKLIYRDDFQVVVDLSVISTPVNEWNVFADIAATEENPLTEAYEPDLVTSYYNHILQEAAGSSINFKSPPKRIAKRITKKEDIDYIISIDHKKASMKSTIMELFGNFGEGSRFNPYDIITIPPKSYGGYSKTSNNNSSGLHAGFGISATGDNSNEPKSSTKKNSTPITTTVGLYIFNKSFIEPMSDILGYINTPVTSGVYGKINSKISTALLDDKISVSQLKWFIMQSQIIMSCCSAIAPSHTETMFAMEEPIAKKKAELLNSPKYKDMIKNSDLVLMKDFEKELIDFAKQILRDDPAIDMFNSGARSSWGNNFKNMYIARTDLKGTDGSHTISPVSYIEGMDPKELTAINDASVGGPYSRSRETANGGYKERLYMASTAHLSIGAKGSDCKTAHTIKVPLTEKNYNDWCYSFIMENGKPVELTPENKSRYVNKTVDMRFTGLCANKNGCLCEACSGTLFRRIGLTNVGIATSIAMSSLKNKSMKRFHDTSVTLFEADLMKVFDLY